MAEVLDFRGLKCPLPVLRLAMHAAKVAPGTTLEVHADCSSFPTDVAKWCKDMGKVLVSCVEKNGTFIATIQF